MEDVTGREDLIESLRNAVLLKTAARMGYNKIARGDCATRVAVRTIASAAKGAGFALPATIQHYDARSCFPLLHWGSLLKQAGCPLTSTMLSTADNSNSKTKVIV